MNKTTLGMTLLLTSLIGAGCSSIVQSTKLDVAEIKSPIEVNKAGYYFLPKIKVRIDGERKALVKDKETTETVEFEKDKEGKEINRKDQTKSITKSNNQLEGEVAQFPCTLTLKEVFAEPDPEYLFRLDHVRDFFADDKLTVTLNPNGLLAKVDISAEDKTGEFVTKIAELAKESAKAFAAVALTNDKAKADPNSPFYFTVIVDPADPKEIERLNTKLDTLNCDIHVDSVRDSLSKVGTDDPKSNSLKSDPLTSASPKVTGGSGIYFRPALPYKLIFASMKQGEPRREIQNTLLLPNKAPVMFLDFKRIAFGKYTHVVEFDSNNGLLKQMNFSVPSSALGFMAVPIEIAKAIASIPGEIIQLKFNVVSKEEALLSKQAELIESQKKRLEAEEALRKYIEDLRKAKQDSPQASGS